MNVINIELLRKLCNENRISWSTHALERIQERNITRKDVKSVINQGKIIEEYPNAFPYPACLLLGMSLNNKNLHVVCGCNGDFIKIITAYYPDKSKFDINGENRKEQT